MGKSFMNTLFYLRRTRNKNIVLHNEWVRITCPSKLLSPVVLRILASKANLAQVLAMGLTPHYIEVGALFRGAVGQIQGQLLLCWIRH